MASNLIKGPRYPVNFVELVDFDPGHLLDHVGLVDDTSLAFLIDLVGLVARVNLLKLTKLVEVPRCPRQFLVSLVDPLT